MRKVLFLLFSGLITASFASPTFAQNELKIIPHQFKVGSAVSKAAVDSSDPVRHFSLELMESPEGKEALRKYHQMKAEGKIPFARKGMDDPVGTVRTFSVTHTTGTFYEDIEFIKKTEGPGFSLWVEVAEINNGHVLDADIEALTEAAGFATLPQSVDPTKGVIVNNLNVFGVAPDVDGDGILDILLMDIRDKYPQENWFVGGFVDPANIAGQNQRDIVHLDTYPTLIDANNNRNTQTSPAQTLAHEYQHLIFWTVNQSGDIAFVNEGLSEFAEVINGFPGRPIDYYQQANERLKPLLDFNNTVQSYQRAGLFTSYIAERIGRVETGALSRAIELNHLNYSAVLASHGLNLDDVLLDFHTANLVNDKSVSTAFGYSISPFTLTRVVNLPQIDGLADTSTDPLNLSLNPGAVYYLKWNDVANLQLEIAGDFAKLEGNLVLETYAGVTNVIPLEESNEGVFIAGGFASITLVLTNVLTDIAFKPATPVFYELRSSWRAAESQFIVQDIIYDTGQLGSVGGFSIFQFTDLKFAANRFEVPQFGSLSSVSVDHAYLSSIPNSGMEGQPRNFTLKIWDESSDGTPGNELFSIDVDDTSPAVFSTTLAFTTISLVPYAAQLENLPDVIFIGTANRGPDENDILILVTDFLGTESPSWLSGGTSWLPFSDPTFMVGTDTFQNSVLPIRARFLIPVEPVATDDQTELPERVTLHQNFPNPFNPTTTIEFKVPVAGEVRLTIYDILGRKVVTLVDEFRTAGVHNINFDASRLSSGIYIYALEASGSKVTKTMTLLK